MSNLAVVLGVLMLSLIIVLLVAMLAYVEPPVEQRARVPRRRFLGPPKKPSPEPAREAIPVDIQEKYIDPRNSRHTRCYLATEIRLLRKAGTSWNEIRRVFQEQVGRDG